MHIGKRTLLQINFSKQVGAYWDFWETDLIANFFYQQLNYWDHWEADFTANYYFVPSRSVLTGCLLISSMSPYWDAYWLGAVPLLGYRVPPNFIRGFGLYARGGD